MINNKIKITGLLIGVCFAGNSFAQQGFQLSQYMRTKNMLNPVFSGMKNNGEITTGYRKQWAGWQPSPNGTGVSPSTFYLAGSTPLAQRKKAPSLSLPLRTGNANQPTIFKEDGITNSKVKHAVGGYLYSDKYGVFNRFSLGASYAAHISLNKKMKLGFGGNLGMTNIGINTSNLTMVDEANDKSYNDLLSNNKNRISFDINLGGMLYSDKFFIGYSGNQVLSELLGNEVFDKSSDLEGRLVVQHNMVAGLNLEVNRQINIIPTVLVKAVKSIVPTVDVGVKAVYDKKYWAGASWRNKDAIVMLLGGKITEIFDASYSYDMNTSDIKNNSSGGHEITITTSIAKKGQQLKSQYLW